MTGEISIRGRVLPIGGLKEKTMAALRHGIRTVIIRRRTKRTSEEIDQTVRQSLNFITVTTVDSVMAAALASARCAGGGRALSGTDVPAMPPVTPKALAQARHPSVRDRYEPA